MFLTNPVMYMDGGDIDDGGVLTFPQSYRRPVVCFVHSDRCSACVRTKPYFQKFAENYANAVTCCGVDIDDTRGREFCSKLGYVARRVPDFLLFVDGRRHDIPQSVGTIADVENFLKSFRE